MERALSFILVVATPPVVPRSLRVALGRVLPVLLATERRQVEQRPDRAYRLDAAAAREVGAVDLASVADEHGEAEQLAVLVLIGIRLSRAAAEIDVEVACERRDPGNLPAHPPAVGLDLLDRRARDGDERGVARVQVGQVADLIEDQRAAGATLVASGAEHEMIQDQLTAPFEQIGEARLARGALEFIRLLDPHARQTPALGRERIARVRGCLLLREQLRARSFPFLLRDDRR